MLIISKLYLFQFRSRRLSHFLPPVAKWTTLGTRTQNYPQVFGTYHTNHPPPTHNSKSMSQKKSQPYPHLKYAILIHSKAVYTCIVLIDKSFGTKNTISAIEFDFKSKNGHENLGQNNEYFGKFIIFVVVLTQADL